MNFESIHVITANSTKKCLMMNKIKYCMNCGKDLDFHSETKVCLKQLNQKILNVFLFDSKNLHEEKGLMATLQVPRMNEARGYF